MRGDTKQALLSGVNVKKKTYLAPLPQGLPAHVRDVVLQLRPKVHVLHTLKDAAVVNRGEAMQHVEQLLEANGYSLVYDTFNGIDFGGVVHAERLVAVAVRHDVLLLHGPFAML